MGISTISTFLIQNARPKAALPMSSTNIKNFVKSVCYALRTHLLDGISSVRDSTGLRTSYCFILITVL